MAQITTSYRTDLAKTIGARSEEYDANTIKDVLHLMRERHGEEVYKNAKAMMITLNGLSIQKKHHFATRLEDGDVVGFFPLAAGG